MDIHKQVAAWLAIVTGVLSLLLVLVVFLFLGGVAALAGDEKVAGIFAVLGSFIFVFFGLFAIINIIAGISYLRGSSIAKVWLIISNILSLFGFPVGTLIGAYSLWAILKEDPPKVQAEVVVDPYSKN
ncbi:MAG: hypothetical protein E6Q34_03470 [Burkholderiaceae bacterium]|nr:MAG: hypothetical protein E6Q34_03470 [Burkholderiaceae bacterium]